MLVFLMIFVTSCPYSSLVFFTNTGSGLGKKARELAKWGNGKGAILDDSPCSLSFSFSFPSSISRRRLDFVSLSTSGPSVGIASYNALYLVQNPE